MERCNIAKLSPTTGVIQNWILAYEHYGQQVTVTVDTPAWYVWLETATSFAFACEDGRFTAHKARAGNGRGGWYWRAYRRQNGRLSRCYLGVSATLTLERLGEAARRLTASSENLSTQNKASGDKQVSGMLSKTSSDGLVPIQMLNTKFALPRLPVQHVSRARLLTLLEQGTQRPLTLVSASAGSGKTTLLAEWATTTALPVVWLSLEVADNDPARFLSYLLATLTRLDERQGIADQPWYVHDHEQALTGPLNDLAHMLKQDAVVILDDYDVITTGAVHAALRFLLDHLPAHLHLIIGTRVDPPLPLARLRARNQLSELRTEELHFASEEVEAFVYAMGLTLSTQAIKLLQSRTEGWITGIQLLTLVLRGHPGGSEATAFLSVSGGTPRFLVDYMIEEILAQQPPAVQRFLLRTCVLERLCGPLCDAVTAQPGGQTQLAALLQANLFVSELDNTRTWYCYHALFAEALRTHLHTVEPELVPELYRRASHWYEHQQQEEEACRYSFLADDLPRAASLLENLIPHLLAQGKFLHMGQWLSQLSSSLVAASPALWLASVSLPLLRTGMLGSSAQTITLLIEQLEQQVQAHAQDEGSTWADLQLALPLVQAMAALVQGDITRSITLAHAILPALAHSESAVSRFIALGNQALLGAAYGAHGDLAAAEQLFLTAAPIGSSSVAHPRKLFAAAGLADLYETQGQLHKLGQFYEDIFQEFVPNTNTSPLLFALMQSRYALLLYEWNRLAEAEKATQRSRETVNVTAPLAPVVALLNDYTQARIALAQGNSDKAANPLEHTKFNLITSQAINPGQRLLGSILARLALACGQLDPALHWMETCGLRFDDSPALQPAANGYFDYITLARVLLAQGRTFGNTSRLSQAVSLLQHLRDLTHENNWQGRLQESACGAA